MDDRPICFFDSGIGGSTILKEVIKKLPNEDYIYYADSKNNIKVPSWTRIDLGAKYDTKIMDNPVTFSLMAYNLTDKKYWSTMTTSYGENALMLNPGRTYILSATWHI